MARLIVGCGYLGSRVARRWLDAGDDVFVVTRSPNRAAALAAQGYRPLLADVTAPATLGGWPAAETVLYAVGYDRAAAKTIEQVFLEGLGNVLAVLPATTRRLIYISSTGVYGDSEGEWVDEATPCQPTRPGGRACLAAEQILLGHPLAERSVVLRLAGIYGPGRIPRQSALLAAEAIAAPRHGYLNLIHVDDAVEAVVAAAERPIDLPRIYLVADGNPGRREDYYAELARQVGAPPPRFVEPPAVSPAAERAAADKRISNTRMLDELGIRLRYPSYREGLAAIVTNDTS
ncbi:MAG TPA: NAD-dependent epimerase/dehydratase family protein [Pirellulales bacterium]|nr:NAD-dependent epimerase/dehydratase family protein [Pirellulales bacterium]